MRIKPWWVLVTFLAGMAVAMLTEDLILDNRNNRLEFSAPHTDFFAGKPMERLSNALEVSFIIRTTLWSGTRNHVYRTAVDQFVVSKDLWEPDKPFQVVKMEAPRKTVSHLTAKAAQAWCLSQMSLDLTGLSDKEPLWARLEIRAEDPPADGSLLGDSVNSSGISLTNGLTKLVEILSRPAGSQKTITLDYPPAFTLDELKHKRGS